MLRSRFDVAVGRGKQADGWAGRYISLNAIGSLRGPALMELSISQPAPVYTTRLPLPQGSSPAKAGQAVLPDIGERTAASDIGFEMGLLAMNIQALLLTLPGHERGFVLIF
ncbi:hypothetical protein AAFF_G00062650 [Aldrovandia affinis]|uniref:Uncharacterized protein n=1 Tax=Aldrovandia affinis TaxID=143900 RepID=A0AAD7WDX4_9TELE|nr:hypothetical protein AAFF_G00062650 [Aldrovandia affinis]